MGGMFVGGAIGSAGAVLVWHMAGWYAVCTLGAALVAIALAHAWSAAGLKGPYVFSREKCSLIVGSA